MAVAGFGERSSLSVLVPLRRFRPNTEPATSVLPSEQNALREFGLELTFVSKPEFSAYPNNGIEA
jgi:hypothetical protein